jgi:hypothetical protein
MQKPISESMPCPQCSKPVWATTYRIASAKMLVSPCHSCRSTNLSILGTPGQIMFDALTLADVFMTQACEIGATIGYPEPFMLEPHELSMIASGHGHCLTRAK